MTLKPTEESLFDWRGSIPGPESSCYEGGVFWIEIHLPPDYPYVSKIPYCLMEMLTLRLHKVFSSTSDIYDSVGSFLLSNMLHH